MNYHNRGSRLAKPGALNPSRDGQAEWQEQSLNVTRRRAGSVMFSSMAWNEIARSLELSARELETVRGTFDDQTESSMATLLHMSPSTVHTHVRRLHYKLGVTDRSQLILRVVQEYLALRTPQRSRFVPICARASSIRRLH